MWSSNGRAHYTSRLPINLGFHSPFDQTRFHQTLDEWDLKYTFSDCFVYFRILKSLNVYLFVCLFVCFYFTGGRSGQGFFVYAWMVWRSYRSTTYFVSLIFIMIIKYVSSHIKMMHMSDPIHITQL